MRSESKRPPFAAGAGVPPPKLAGRDFLIEEFDDGLEALEDGDYFGPRALVAPRGLGKTVLLLEFQERAQERGWQTHRIIVRRSLSVEVQLLQAVNELLRELQPGRQAIRSFTSQIAQATTLKVATTKLSPISVEWTVGGARDKSTRAHMGDDLQRLLAATGDVARSKHSGVAIFIDEAHEARSEDLESLAVAIHELSTYREHKPVAITAAGLPQLKERAMNAGTYGERMFVLCPVNALAEHEVFEALREPARARGRDYTDDALRAIAKQTQGYPYLVQVWGERTWRQAGDAQTITLKHVRAAEPRVEQYLDASFFDLRSARMTNREREYVEAMAQLPEGQRKTSEVARLMNRSPEAVSKFREGLIEKGVVREDGRGWVEFTVPGYDKYLKRLEATRSRGLSR